MEKKAFVVMPYDKRFNRVYSILIQGALERAGYECIRQDMTSQGGYILKNVIRNLAESDLVICLLSDFNWNVAYELGMRHAMARKGTILMCQKDQEKDLKFDLKGTNILFYEPDWLNQEKDEQIIGDILKMIHSIEANNEPDSPAYDVYPQLPQNLIEFAESDENAEIQKLRNENMALKKTIEEAGLDRKETAERRDFRKTLMEAIQNSIYYSDTAVEKLRELSTEEDKTEFASFLADVIEKGYLDEVDCKNVYTMCRRISIPPLTKAFLEKAVELHPDSEELNIYLANELAKNYNTQDQAFRLANEMFGVVKKTGTYELTKHVSERILGTFFDVYLKLKKFTEITQLADLLLNDYSKSSAQCVILRNTAYAYSQLEQFTKAKEFALRAIDANPAADMNHYFYVRILFKEENYIVAYLELEKCIRCDPDDEDYYYMLAGLICDESIACVTENDMPHKIDDSKIRQYAVPFIIAALERDASEASLRRARDFLLRNHFESDFSRCIEVLQKGEDLLSAFDGDLDFTVVYRCLNLTQEQLRQPSEQALKNIDRIMPFRK